MSTVTESGTLSRGESLRDEFIAMRLDGATYREIGAKHSLSHERVRQIIGDVEGLDRASVRETRRQAVVDRVLEHLRANGPTRRSELLVSLGMTQKEWREIASEIPRSLLLAESGHTADYFTDDDIRESLQTAWGRVQTLEPGTEGLSRAAYDSLRRSDEISGPRVVARYGSWIEACTSNDVPHGAVMRPSSSYTTQWDDEDLLLGVAEYVKECVAEKRTITYLGYDLWQRDYPEHASGTLVRNRLGLSWAEIVDAAIELAATSA
jgi:hypothetical protein